MDSEIIEPGTSLAILGPTPLNPVAIFQPGGVDSLLTRIKAAALLDASKLDISTAKGRAAIASLAMKVAKSKTALETMGKALGEDHYRQWKAIVAERNNIETELDALRDEVRKPLTDWENADKDRVQHHEEMLTEIMALAVFDHEYTAAMVRQRIDHLNAMPARKWEEFQARADNALRLSSDSLKDMLAAAEKREAEQAELERLRAAEAARLQRERDEKIAQDAADKARKEAEEKAEREKQEAIEAERQRVADAKAAEDAETARREADTKHKAKINNAVKDAIMALGIAEITAKAVVAAIAKGTIPHTKIEY